MCSVDEEIDCLTRSSIDWSTSMSVLSFSSICWIGDVWCRSKLEREQDNSSTRQLIDMVFADNSPTQLKTTHRHFLKTIHRHIIMLKLYLS